MALVLADRIRETTTTTGTGTITLAGAVTGFRTFAAVGNGNTTYYTISGQNTSEWEVGIGTYASTGTTLSRDTVLASSNAGALVTFSAGTKDVYVVYPAGKSVNLTATNALSLTAPTSGTLLTVDGGSTSSLSLSVTGSYNSKLVDFNSTNANGAWGTFSNSGTVIGYIGAAAAIIGGSASDFILNTPNTLRLAAGSASRLSIANTGAVTIAAPASGSNALTINTIGGATSPLVITGVASQTGANISTSTPSGTTNYWRLGQPGIINWDIQNIATTGEFRITNGTQIPFNYGSTAGMLNVTSAAGNILINAPTSGTTVSATGGSAQAVFSANVTGNGIALATNNGTATGVVGYYVGNGTFFGSTSAHDMGLLTTNTVRLTVNSTGNVTINQPSSGAALTATASTTGYIAVLNDAGGAGVTWRNATNTTGFDVGLLAGTASADAYVYNRYNGANLILGASNSPSITINGSRQVTIAAPTSGTALTVNGAAGIQYWVTTSARGAGNNYQSWYDTTGRKGYIAYGASDDTFFIANELNAAMFLQTNAITRLSIGASGNVTINQPSGGNIPLTLNGYAGGYALYTPNSPMVGGIVTTTSALQFYVGSAHEIDFITNGAARQIITSAGNVQINAPASGTALTVIGLSTSSVTGSFQGTGTGANLVQFNNTGGNGYIGIESSGGGVTGSGITGYSMAVATTGATSLWLGTNNAGRLQIGSAGNVTINQPSSGIPLTVNGLATTGVISQFSGVGSNFIIGGTTPFVTGLNLAADTTLAIGTTSASAMYFFTNYIMRGYITVGGNWVVSTPTSGIALTVNGETNSTTYTWNGSNINVSAGGLLNTNPDVSMLTKGSGVLGDGLFGDELAFNPPTTAERWNGSAWSSTTVVGSCFSGKNAFNFGSAYTLTSTTYSKVRFTWNSFGYKFWDALAWVGSANGSQYSAMIESSTDGVTWVTNLPDTAAGSDWPGYHVIRTAGNNSSSNPYLRITISVSAWAGANTVSIANVSLYGSYGSQNRLIDWDYQRSIVNYGTLNVNSNGLAGPSLTVNAPASGTALVVNNGALTTSALTLSTTGDITTNGPGIYQRFNYGAGSAGGYIGYGGTANQFEIYNYLNGPISFITNSATRMSIGGGGNITIVAPTSGVPLTINGLGATNTAVIYFQSSTTGSQYVQYNNSGNTTNVGIESSAGGTLVGGSSAYSTVLANNGARDLILGTNNATRMKIDSSGSVTINTPGSGAALTVNGVVNFDSTPRIGYLASSDTFAEGGLTIPNYGMVWGVNTAISAGVSTNISGYSGIGLFTAGTRRITIGGSGNVTINAPSSGNALTVNGLGAAGSTASFVNGSTVLLWQGTASGATGFGTNSAHDFAIASNGVNRVLVGTAGNVTVNAPTSGTALTVNGTGGTTLLLNSRPTGGSTLSITGSGINTNLISITSTGGSAIYGIDDYIGGFVFTGSSAYATVLGSSGATSLEFGTNSIIRFKINSAGNATHNAPTSGVGLTVRAVSGTHSTQIADSANTLYDAGYLGVPQNSQTGAYVLVLADRGKHISITTGGVTVNASIFSAGDAITIYNNSASSQTITQGTSVTMYLGGTATTGNRTLAQRGVCTVLCVASNTFVISGAGLT